MIAGLNSIKNLIFCQKNIIIYDVINKCLENIDDNDNILICNNIQTTIPLIQATIPQIQTTIHIIQTTIPKITIPEVINEQTSLILLGFNHFKLSSSKISLNILFTPILNKIYSNLMKVPLIINYNDRLRILEEKEIECYLKEKNKTNIVSFFCETEIKNSNIKKLKLFLNLILLIK